MAIIILLDGNATQKIKRKKYLRLGLLFRKSTIYAGQICPPYNDAFSRNLDNWPKQKSNFLWKQIHSKTLFLVKVICSPTSLKV